MQFSSRISYASSKIFIISGLRKTRALFHRSWTSSRSRFDVCDDCQDCQDSAIDPLVIPIIHSHKSLDNRCFSLRSFSDRDVRNIGKTDVIQNPEVCALLRFTRRRELRGRQLRPQSGIHGLFKRVFRARADIVDYLSARRHVDSRFFPWKTARARLAFRVVLVTDRAPLSDVFIAVGKAIGKSTQKTRRVVFLGKCLHFLREFFPDTRASFPIRLRVRHVRENNCRRRP